MHEPRTRSARRPLLIPRCALVLGVVAMLAGAQPTIDETETGAPDGAAPVELLRSVYESTLPKSRGEDRERPFSRGTLESLYGVQGGDMRAGIDIDLRLGAPIDDAFIDEHALSGVTRIGDNRYMARIPLGRVPGLLGSDRVDAAIPIEVSRAPDAPDAFSLRNEPKSRGDSIGSVFNFDRDGLSGEGVIVAVFDSGIDWRHPDFLNDDGSTRILAFYDMSDPSYAQSGGSSGLRPPIWEKTETGTAFLGTVYGARHINKALADGSGLGLNSAGAPTDSLGHGTQVAGVAAGSVGADGYGGVAPGADIIAVRVSWTDENGGEKFYPDTFKLRAIQWVIEQSKALGKPCVLNMSFGSSNPPRDASAPMSLGLDGIIGENDRGVIACVSAGNTGDRPIRAESRFGGKGQVNQFGSIVSLNVGSGAQKTEAVVHARFDTRDDWVVTLKDVDGTLYKRGAVFHFYPQAKRTGPGSSELVPGVQILEPATEGSEPAWSQDSTLRRKAIEMVVAGLSSFGGSHWISLKVPSGRFVLQPYGRSERVANGRVVFNLSSIHPLSAFGFGGIKAYTIGAPGTSRNAITVGSLTGRTRWEGPDSTVWIANLESGALSRFSSQGYVIDGRPKPDISAPGEYVVSAMARGSSMQRDAGNTVASSGMHRAWTGTSASTPFVAGVVALMLERDPTLTTARVREIFRTTAIVDDTTQGVPNDRVGWGKLDPAGAIDAVR